MLRGTRCPHCRGPVARYAGGQSPGSLMGTCIACGAIFPIHPSQQREHTAVFSPRADPWIAAAGCAIVLVIALSLLAHFQILGGVLLILIGVGIVVLVGALEAGYLDEQAASIRAGLAVVGRAVGEHRGIKGTDILAPRDQNSEDMPK
jgi:hypothetical protein